MYTHIISHGDQNVTMTFNVSGKGHSAKALKLRYLANCWFYGVLFDMYTRLCTMTLIFDLEGQGHILFPMVDYMGYMLKTTSYDH